ncbi:unnamed protein product [Caenorhabditis nigoni]
MLGKQVLIASLMLIAFNYATNTYNAKRNELVLEMSKRDGTNCGKVTQKELTSPLEIIYARVLTVSGTGSDLTITKNNACSRITEKSARAHRFSCQESLDFNNAYLLLAVTSNGKMLSSQIEYRYQEKHMHMFAKKLTTAEVLKTESFQPDTHISINKIVSNGFEQSGPENNCIKEETYPDNLIGDHGLYVTKLVNGNSAKATTWTRIYFDPDSVGEHLIVPV